MKNTFFITVVFAALIGLFASCSKETSIETSTVDSLATIQIVPVDSTIYGVQNGAFVSGTSDSSAYISIPVLVSKAGTYSISAYAIYGTDTFYLEGSGDALLTDDSIHLYATNIASFAAGTYSTSDSTLNKIYLNDTAVANPFVLNIVVSAQESATVSNTRNFSYWFTSYFISRNDLFANSDGRKMNVNEKKLVFVNKNCLYGKEYLERNKDLLHII